ncbi:MAG: DUF3822 family protein [Lentimicrobiaceae bacterium]|nr:DUF3822 family protein [Lentimicrobiaceae bacterium]
MPTIITDTPAYLVPKELCNEEKIQEYWNIMHDNLQQEKICKDELDNFFLIYPKQKEEDTIHEITVMHNYLKENYLAITDAICINVYNTNCYLWALKDRDIAYTGSFQYSEKEDILYHLANISHHFFENISPISFFYQQLSSDLLRFLSKYYEIKKLQIL